MRRRRRLQKTDTGVTLFPFMAVLICTMGTLIVLLMVVVRQARVRADTVAQEHVQQREAAVADREAEREQARLDRETQQWRFEQLQQSRQKTTQQLAESRLKLSHVEDHTRRLEDNLTRLLQEKELLDRAGRDQRTGQDANQAEIERLERRLAEEREALEAARQEAARQPRSYAIIPYDGPHGTHRRPVYIECFADRVVLQPEGIVLDGGDFRGPLGPGNPLAAGLRAIREYWTRNGGPEAGSDAYPLLIVRSGGAEAFLACRQAMKSWDDEFGYELVSDDLRIAYPPADPALADLLKRTVHDARQQQQQLLMAAALARPGTRQRRPYLRATSSAGGFVVEGGPSGRERGRTSDGGSSSPWRGGTQAGETGPGYGGGQGGDEPFSDRVGSPGTGGDSMLGAGDPPPQGEAASAAASDAPAGGRSPQAGRSSHPDNRSATGAGMSRESGGSSQPGDPAGNPDTPAARPGGSAPARPGEPPPRRASPDQSGTTASPATPHFGAQSAAVGGAGGPAAAGSVSPCCENLPNLADTRGRDWALPGAARGATGLNRPIRIVCTANQLKIVPQRGSGQPLKVVPLEGSAVSAVDRFVSTLWQYIEDWGIAGPGLYWKPELQVEVAPGGQQRFEQLKHLLNDSGIQVKQRTR